MASGDQDRRDGHQFGDDAAALERAQAQLDRAREQLEVFSQLTSGYWWSVESRSGKPTIEAWRATSFVRATGDNGDLVEGLARGEQVHPGDAEAVAATLAEVMRGADQGGRDWAAHEFRIRARDGSTLWVRQRLEGRGRGPDRRVHASGELVTERKRTEATLGQVEARLLSLVEHAPNIIMTVDLSGGILFVNRPLPGDPREPWQLIGTSAYDLTTTSRATLEPAIALVTTHKQTREFEWRGAPSGPDSAPAWFQVYAAPVTHDGEVVAITLILMDVSQRRIAEHALRRSEARWRFLWENVPDLIAELDLDGHVVVSNRPIGTGPPPGSTVFEFVRADAAEVLRVAMDEAIRTGLPQSFEVSVLDAEGHLRWWSNRVVPLLDGDSRGVLLIGTDVTDHKVAEDERTNLEAHLRQQQKLESIGTLASGVAHEINNPIQSIMNYADLVRMRAEPGGMVADFAGEIISETERVANIVRSLLAFARQEKEHHSPAWLSDIIASTLTLMAAVLRRDNITLDLDLPPDLPQIKCRSQQLQQVFMNLLANARDALNARYPEYDEDKRVLIVARGVERDGEHWVRTTVEDHGTGIDAAILDRIFDPFFTTKGRDEGTGLGLSVSHGIVREHHGELEVESELGVYTRFTLSLRVDNGWELASRPDPTDETT